MATRSCSGARPSCRSWRSTVRTRFLEGEGERVWVRYRLGTEAQQFLNGEFPEGGLRGALFAPAPPGE